MTDTDKQKYPSRTPEKYKSCKTTDLFISSIDQVFVKNTVKATRFSVVVSDINFSCNWSFFLYSCA